MGYILWAWPKKPQQTNQRTTPPPPAKIFVIHRWGITAGVWATPGRSLDQWLRTCPPEGEWVTPRVDQRVGDVPVFKHLAKWRQKEFLLAVRSYVWRRHPRISWDGTAHQGKFVPTWVTDCGLDGIAWGRSPHTTPSLEPIWAAEWGLS